MFVYGCMIDMYACDSMRGCVSDSVLYVSVPLRECPSDNLVCLPMSLLLCTRIEEFSKTDQTVDVSTFCDPWADWNVISNCSTRITYVLWTPNRLDTSRARHS